MLRKNIKRKRVAFWRFLQGNDVVLRIYTSFAFILALTGILTGTIFMQLYQSNYIRSYTGILTKQGEIIAEKVAVFAASNAEKQFISYCEYIDETLQAEKTDVWILAREEAEEPLAERFVNSDVDVDGSDISDESMEILQTTFDTGEIASQSNYDSVYGMTTLNVTVPIIHADTGEVVGAVMMVSMIDRQTMGLREGKYLITLSVFLAIIISYIVAVFFSKFLSKPLEKVGGHIAKLANGDYTAIKVEKPYSQIGIVEKSLDRLAGELRKTKREQEELDQVRMDFFANVSHELRTPITVMRGYTESLADGVIDDPEMVQDLHQRMLQECKGMERLVADLFILSKMQNPDFHMEMEPVSLQQVFGDVIRSGKILGKEKGIELLLDAPEDDPCLVLGDYGRLRQMFLVITDNAVKFSHENGVVEITIHKVEGKYQIAIRDHGVGIASDQLAYIFEKFYTSKMRQNEKGTGLGLMIARQIALRHGGDILVNSELDKGTTFFFEFEECTSFEGFE